MHVLLLVVGSQAQALPRPCPASSFASFSVPPRHCFSQTSDNVFIGYVVKPPLIILRKHNKRADLVRATTMSSPGETAVDGAESTGPTFVSRDEVRTLYAVAGAFLALALIAVVCRALALYTKRTWGKWDDWTMMFCIAPAASLAAFMCIQGKKVAHGPQDQDPFEWLQNILLATWIIQILTVTCFYVVKLSLCIRYLRIADNADDWFWRLSMLTIVFVTAHYISSVVVWGAQCLPAARYWNLSIPGRCIDLQTWTLSVNAVNLATDAVVLILPIRPIWKLRMPLKQRLAILSIFGLGSVSTVAGCFRFHYMYQFYKGPTDLGQTTLLIEVWAYIEISLGIFCGCAPSFRTLWTALRDRIGGTDAWQTMNSHTSSENSTGTSYGRSEKSKAAQRLSRETRFEMVQWGGQPSTSNSGQAASYSSQHSIMEATREGVQEDHQSVYRESNRHSNHDRIGA
ncbi:hypothetical protein CB0940_08064 [Cercospora beticola]|uniref:Rhodopsin domain-containing protein n=2 Tax=Cercospora beticola TaxID=122368 RepID=A0A2G5HNL2_CERBT|nr:hypothetical protein CB0940_08064 [Cercospora beticola]PIA94120.1 hypothetical protein CB0940_08064 [Cercospora beticola]